MKFSANKVMDLSSTIKQFVNTGSHISFGGFTLNRAPMAAVYEIIRSGINNLHVYAHSSGQVVEELAGAGCIDKLEIAYCGAGKFAPTGVKFREVSVNQTVKIEDYTNYQMSMRFLAGAMGIPFLPTKSSLGTDIITKWGFTKEFRQKDEKIPNQKLIEAENPFGQWADATKLVFVPAINPDVTIVHVQKADVHGNVRIEGLAFADAEQAKASKVVIVTCEELIEDESLKINSEHNQIPFIHVDAVVHQPYGAYPCACHNHYDYDPNFFRMFAECAKNDELFAKYQQDYIFSPKSHNDFLELRGKAQLKKVKASKRTGYAIGLDRD